MENKIRAAFGAVRADSALLESAAARLNRARTKTGPSAGRPLTRRLAMAAVMIAALVAGIFGHSLYFAADAYVGIDVNPSLELTLNRFGVVIATHAYDDDGAHVISEANPQGKPYAEAAGLLLSAVEADGYLADDALVSITVRAADSGREQLLCDTLEQLITERVLHVQTAAQVEVFPVTAEIWQHSHGHNVSPAKYLAIQDLIEVDKEATIEAYGGLSIPQIRQRAHSCEDEYDTQPDNPPSASSGEHGDSSGSHHGH